MSKPKYKNALQRALNFTDEDLEANRRGRLTRRQVKGIQNYGLILGLLPFSIALFVTLLMVNNSSTWTMLGASCLTFLCLVPPALLFIVMEHKTWDETSRKLRRATGRIRLEEIMGEYAVYIEIRRIVISYEIYQQLKDNGRYSFYFTTGHHLLSVEEISVEELARIRGESYAYPKA